MIRVTRFDADGKVFHTALTPSILSVYTNKNGVICISMTLRHWVMVAGGRLEIEAV